MDFFGFSIPADINIRLKGDHSVHTRPHKDNTVDEIPVVNQDEQISGVIEVEAKSSISFEYLLVEFIGQTEFLSGPERNNRLQFVHLELPIMGIPGKLKGTTEFPFTFPRVVMPYESYDGINVRVQYFIQFTCTRSIAADIRVRKEVRVRNYQEPPEINNSIKLEVGIEDCLHIEFEYNQCKFHLMDAIIGKIYFLLLRVQLKHMELEILRKEWTGSDSDSHSSTQRLSTFEVMDGAPMRGESIPVRIYLENILALTPTYTYPAMKYQVRYYLNVVLVDSEDRRYFKQAEIFLWRPAPAPAAIANEINETSPYTACSGTVPT
eukprot:TRINITY_DN9344_c0_g1_i1.p1 TRINITY_DN9344_c0_g1~~TRINITY_DN9344_c0_g1_i1.p1  ORF type:complete len:322 (+),score=31.32 TRINITY_DN9344_c0_g1_i1:3-968(+)